MFQLPVSNTHLWHYHRIIFIILLFSYNYTSRHIAGFGDVVTSLCGLFNEPEENKGWFFYTPPNQIVDKPLNKVELTSGMEVVARFEPFEREEQKAQVNRK